MIHREKCIVLDVDGTLCSSRQPDQTYADVAPNTDLLARLREYQSQGFYIILHTSRNMNTFDGNIGSINKDTAPVLLDWLRKHDVPFAEIHFGKPWTGRGGFCVDDKAIRPAEFTTMSYEQIIALVGRE